MKKLKNRIFTGEQGFTLVEVMVIVIIMSVFFIMVGNVFYNLSKGTFFSKARTIATNLAQERVEYLKDYSYHRLMVTTQADLDTYGYDNTYYPKDSPTVGNISFTRTVLIKKAIEENNRITEVPPDRADTGLKEILISIQWIEGGDTKTYSLRNLRNDPNRSPLDCKIYGTVTSGGSPVSGARVFVTQNLNYETYTQSDGYYDIDTATGQYNVKVTKSGYWDAVSNQLNLTTDSKTAEYSPALQAKVMGKIGGCVVINDHPVIGQVIASHVSPLAYDQETVTLYNPTTSTYQLCIGTVTELTTFYFELKYADEDNNWNPDPNIPLIHTCTGAFLMYPYTYALIANTSPVTIGGIIKPADFIYDWTNALVPVTGDIIKADKAGGVVVTTSGTVVPGEIIVDRVAWGDKNWPVQKAPPAKATEGSGYVYPGAGAKFPNANWRIDRHSFVGNLPWPTVTWTDGNSPCYDTERNNADFYDRGMSSARFWNSASPPCKATTGRPAVGAIVTCNDPDSQMAVCTKAWGSTVYSGGAQVYVATFTITATTSTWTVMASSTSVYSVIYGTSSFYREVTEVLNLSTGVIIPNLQTNPSFNESGLDYNYRTVDLSSSPSTGMVTGYVRTAVGGAGVSNILVRIDTNEIRTDSSGKYVLRATTSAYVEANPANDNPAYSNAATDDEVHVVHGAITNVPDLVIHTAGQINGWVTSNIIDGLPGVVILADNGAGLAYTAQSGTDGKFLINNVTTGTYTIYPVLDNSESYTAPPGGTPNTPIVKTIPMGFLVWSSTFVVTGAYGTISGKVYQGNSLIKTGVLLVATTATIGDLPDPVSLSNINLLTYYSAVSKDDGTYEVSVRRSGTPYNLYGWYTEISGSATTTTKRTKTNLIVSDTSPTQSNIDFGPGAGDGAW